MTEKGEYRIVEQKYIKAHRNNKKVYGSNIIEKITHNV